MCSSIREGYESSIPHARGICANRACARAEVVSVSFHDASGETLWLSEDFLLPEDHELVEDALANGRGGVAAIESEEKDDRRYVVVIPVRSPTARFAARRAWGWIPTAPRPTARAARAAPRAAIAVSRGRIGRTSRGAARAGRKIRASAPKSNGRSCEERFELFLQPIHPLRLAESAARYEVLLRLRMPDDSLIEPAAFLGAAAQLELMPVDRPLGGAHAARVAAQSPRLLDAHADRVRGQRLGAGAHRSALRELRRILSREERDSAAGAVLRGRRALGGIGQRRRLGGHVSARGARLRGGSRSVRRECTGLAIPARRARRLLQDRRLARECSAA
jgi:hypothetical protein